MDKALGSITSTKNKLKFKSATYTNACVYTHVYQHVYIHVCIYTWTSACICMFGEDRERDQWYSTYSTRIDTLSLQQRLSIAKATVG
jgi:hypothetical protein